MRIESIEWRNFASYGNKKQKIEFDRSNGKFFLIIGKNGSGKSTMSDIIQFALYGRVDKKRLSDVVNRFNNGLEVKIVLWKNQTTKVTIERGLSPGFLKLSINDKEYDQAGKKNINSYIEEDIIKMPFYVFNNIISLSINDFKSFLSMGTRDKRMIIDRIFNLDIMNDVRIYIKEEIKELKNLLYLIDKEIDMIKSQMDISLAEMRKVEQSLKEHKKTSLDKFKERIIELTNKKENIRDQILKITQKETAINTRLEEIREKHSTESAHNKMLNKQIKLLSLDKCPTCAQSFKNDEMISILQETIDKEHKSKETIKSLASALQKHKATKEKIIEMKAKANHFYSKVSVKINELDKKIKEHDDFNESKELEYLRNISKSSEKTLTEKQVKKDKNKNKLNFLAVIENMFGDKGIKQLALQQIIPSLNNEIANVLAMMHLEYRVLFDTEFNPIIRHLGYDVSQQQLSTGEKKKIDFAILISLIRMIKMKNNGLNLFFLDEIFASLDSDAIHHVLEILGKLSEDLNLNIFVINHTILPSELFDYKIDVKKENNFSHLDITEIV